MQVIGTNIYNLSLVYGVYKLIIVTYQNWMMCYFHIKGTIAGISIRAGTRRYVAASNEWNRRFDC